MARPKTFVCQSCGAATAKWAGRCESCGAWNTIVEEVASEARPGDLVVVMSNGGFGGIHGKLLEALA